MTQPNTPNEIEARKCSYCKTSQPIANFQRDGSRTSGYSYRCKSCEKARDWSWRDWRKNDLQKKEAHPQKVLARQMVHNATRYGKLKKEPCVVCSNPKSQGHHEDYSKPLEVIWLCQTCHDHKHHA